MTRSTFGQNLTAWTIDVRRMMFQDMTGRQAIGRLLRSPMVTSSLLGWVARIAQMGFQIISVRLVITVLGANAYGGVVLLSGLVGWMANFEFGFSFGLMNTIATTKAKGESDAALRTFALFCYVCCSAIGIVSVVTASPFVAGRFLAAIPGGNHIELLAVSASVLVLVGTANIGNRLMFADQRVHLFYMISLLTTALSFGCVVLIYLKFLPPRIETVILAMFGPQALLGLIGMAVSVRHFRIELPHWPEVRSAVSISLKFLMLNFMTLLTIQTDTLVISQLLNAHEIATYGIYSRIFLAMNMLVTTPLGILWPRFSAHAARGESREMRNLLASFIFISIGLMASFGVFVYLFGGWIIGILAPHQNIVAPPYFVLVLTLLQISILWTGSFHTAALSMSILKPALILTPMQAVISFTAEWYLTKHFGIIGVTGGLLLSYLVLAVWIGPLIFWILMRRHFAKFRT